MKMTRTAFVDDNNTNIFFHFQYQTDDPCNDLFKICTYCGKLGRWGYNTWSGIIYVRDTLSEKEQEISRLKDVGRKSNDQSKAKGAIDRLTVYGKEGIIPITEIIEDPAVHESIKQYGLNAIKRIRIFTPFKP